MFRILLRVPRRVSLRCERAATSVEYGVILALIAAAIVVSVATLGAHTNAGFECVGTSWRAATSAC